MRFQTAEHAAGTAYLRDHPKHGSHDTGCPDRTCMVAAGAPCTQGAVALYFLHAGRTRLIDRKNDQRRRAAQTAGRAYARSLGMIPPD